LARTVGWYSTDVRQYGLLADKRNLTSFLRLSFVVRI
jgi:hypothetical protein